MSRFKMKAALVALLGLGAISPAAAATTVYTDRAAFDLATGGSLSFEDFSGGTTNPAGFNVSGTNVFVTGGNQLLGRPTVNGDNMTFVFDSPITAFGGDYDTAPGGSGIGLQFTLGTGEIVSEGLSAPFDAFWGFVADTPFSTLTVSGGTGPGFAETHFVDNLSFGVAVPVAPVPVPAGIGLLLAALAGLFGWRQLGVTRTA